MNIKNSKFAGAMLPFPVDLEQDTLCDVINRWAKVQPEAPALVTEGKTPLSYRALSSQMEEIRSALNASGLGRGDRIGLLHSGGAEMLSALFGILNGATVVPLNQNLRADEFKTHMESSAVTALLIESGLGCPAQEEARRAGIPCLRIANADPSISGKISVDIEEGTKTNKGKFSSSNNVAFISSTSGTTSRCKVLALTWQKILTFCQSETAAFQLGPDDKYYAFRPLYYNGPLLHVLCVLYSGGMVFTRPHFDPERFFQDLKRHRITWFSGGPTFLYAIHERAQKYGKMEGQTLLRHIRATSGRADPKVLDELEQLLGVPVLESYAASEAGPITSNLPPPNLSKRGTVGVRRDNDVAILGSDGSFQETGNPGEIIVRGPHVIRAYENDPEANAQAFVDGWFHTGDLGFFDKDGYLTLTGRIKEMINRGGEKISPTEVDDALMEHPSVAEAVTFPFRHPTLGEEVAAVVVLNPGEKTTDSDLIDYLFERLVSFKIPKTIIISEDIPKSEDGKVKREALAETLGVRVKG